MHIKFNDKEHDNKISKLVESFKDKQIFEDASELVQVSGSASEVTKCDDAPEVPETDAPSRAQLDDEDSEEVYDGLEGAI